MIRRLGILFGVELEKAIRQWGTWAGVLLVLAGVAGALWLAPIAQDGRGDYAYPAQASGLALHTLGLFVILVFNAGLVSSELASGSIRATLVRPVRRMEYVVAKLLLGLVYALFLTLLATLLIWALVYTFGDRNGVTFGGVTLYGHGELLRAYFLGIATGFPPIAALCAWGLFVSCMTRNPAGAVGVAVGGWLLVDAVKYPLGIDSFIFTSYLDLGMQPYRDMVEGIDGVWWPLPLYSVVSSSFAFGVFLGVSCMVMNRRNLSG